MLRSSLMKSLYSGNSCLAAKIEQRERRIAARVGSQRVVSSLDAIGDRSDVCRVFLHADGERRLSEAIAVVEARSRVELVVVVRPAAGEYLGNDMIVASVAALATLAFQL